MGKFALALISAAGEPGSSRRRRGNAPTNSQAKGLQRLSSLERSQARQQRPDSPKVVGIYPFIGDGRISQAQRTEGAPTIDRMEPEP